MPGKKKAKKSSGISSKVSLAKLSNKRLNKLAKQGKLKAKLPKHKYLSFIKSRASRTKVGEEEPELQNHKEDADIPLEEADYDYYAKPGRDFSFLSDVSQSEEYASKRGKKRSKTDSDEVENSYEVKKKDGDSKEYKTLLPIKGSKGIVQRTVEVEREDGSSSPKKAKKEETETEEQEPLPALSTAQLFRQRQEKLREKKQNIALLGSSILEDPEENCRKLKELRMMLEEDDPDLCVTIKKLVMVSLKEIFKDIIPDYRIRLATEAEKQQSAKKETKKLRDFEQSLVANYKHYLEFLESITKGKPPKSKDKKKGRPGGVEVPQEAMKALKDVATSCLCEILATHPHFNFRANIIAIIVPLMGDNKKEVSEKVCACVKRIFKEDKSGEVTLEITRLIGRLIKMRHFNVHPRVLNTFLSLKIKEVRKGKEEEQKSKPMFRKERFKKTSRKDRKREKQVGALEKELKDAAAMDDTSKRLKVHTEIINMVFLTYFRILKMARQSILLSSVLEGLAKFAHLINIEFFEDLFSVLNELIESDELTYRQSLHCIQTAFKILTGQGIALNIDPLRFYKHLYGTLFELHLGDTNEDVPTALECLDIMINKRRKQVTLQRLLSFVKRLSMLTLQLDTNGTLATLAATRSFLQADSKSDILFETESHGSGIFMPQLEDPEHCNANNTALYELHLLKRHFHPTVRKYTAHMIAKMPSHGNGQLSAEIVRKTPVELFKEYDSSLNQLQPPMQKNHGRIKKIHKMGEFLQPEVKAITTKCIDAVDLKTPVISLTVKKSDKNGTVQQKSKVKRLTNGHKR